ncbi:carboxypeptidase M32 [Haladaptatus sp. NG-WS-4]
MKGADPYEAFQEHVERLLNVSHASRILDWDQQTMMPAGATTARSRQLAALSGVEHDLLTSEKMGLLLDELDKEHLEPVEAANVREIRRKHDRAARIPLEHIERSRQARSDAFEAWQQAKSQADFARFAPTLGELVDLKRTYAEHIDSSRDPYRVLFEEYEPYLDYDAAMETLETLKERLPPLVAAIQQSDVKLATDTFYGEFEPSTQERMTRDILGLLGYDWDRGRLDTAPHPFQRGSQFDARVTTRFSGDDLLDGLTSTIHEFGHACYVLGLPDEHYGTPVGEARDMTIHESQSRFWENHVGRSRAFWQRALPRLAEAFPHLSSVSVDAAYEAANQVHEDNLIRVDADELTYHLHIVLRFEIERALVRGEMDVDEVPQVWNDKMVEYLGVRPETDADGCLQDVHWSNATFGYFPTYSLGSVLAAQLHAAAQAQLGDLDGVISESGFGRIKSWLRENIHRHGKRYPTDELIEAATGEPLSPTYFLDYLDDKYSRLYDL